MKFTRKKTKKLLQRQNVQSQIKLRFTPVTNLKIGTYVTVPIFSTQKGISKKLQPIRKGRFKLMAKSLI